METGDPKQVAVLAVMAVGAVGFLVTRLGGHHAPPAPAAVAATKKSASRSVVAFALAHDPFSNPHLAQKPVEAPKAAVAVEPIEKVAPMLVAGPLPPVEPGVQPLPPAGPLVAKKNAKPPTPVPTTIGLEAIAGASEAVAFLTVGGTESRPFHPNDTVSGEIRLLRVEDGAVVLTGPKGKLTIGVGERKTL